MEKLENRGFQESYRARQCYSIFLRYLYHVTDPVNFIVVIVASQNQVDAFPLFQQSHVVEGPHMGQGDYQLTALSGTKDAFTRASRQQQHGTRRVCCT